MRRMEIGVAVTKRTVTGTVTKVGMRAMGQGPQGQLKQLEQYDTVD